MNSEEKVKQEIAENLAHVDCETQRCQSMREHSENVAQFSGNVCELSKLKNIVKLARILHDVGKLGKENQNDFKKF